MFMHGDSNSTTNLRSNILTDNQIMYRAYQDKQYYLYQQLIK